MYAGILCAAALLALATASGRAQATPIADFAADFSATTNPAGAWSYGMVSTLGGAFSASTALTSYAIGNVVKAWSPGIGANSIWPTVGLNTDTAAAQFGAGNAIQIAPGQGLLHPGPTGDFADVRLAIGAATTALLSVSFSGIDLAGTTTDVHILLNGVSLFDDVVNGYGDTAAYSAIVTLAAGDVLDFVVGRGGNVDFTDDSTGFYANLTAVADVPEPASALVLAVATVGLVEVRRRRMMAAPAC